MAEYLLRNLLPGQKSFVLVEGVPESVALGMATAWNDSIMPELAVVSRSAVGFGKYALPRDVSGTQLRNQSSRGVVLVLCDGEQLADRQSLTLFQSLSPSDLLNDPEGLALLAQQAPQVVDLDGPGRAVRMAIVQADPAARPSALAVADYLDQVARGADPLQSLPTIGGFADSAVAGEVVDSTRILDNFLLAARSTGEELLRQTAYGEVRRRAERVLRQRPGLAEGNEHLRVADRVMQELTAGDPALLRSLRFNEARAILEQRTEDLSVIVRREMSEFRAVLVPGSQALHLPWSGYEKRADELGRGATRVDAAKELCDLDDAQQRLVFSKGVRAKLEKQRRDRAVNGSSPSCPEAAIVKAAQQLGGTLIQRVQLIGPTPPPLNSSSTANRSGAGRILTLACARLRLGGLFHLWEQADGEIDGLLLHAADDDDLGGSEGVLAAFGDSGLTTGTALPALQLRLHADDGSTVQIDWRPDMDDAAMLRAALLFAEVPALSLSMDGEPTLNRFCSMVPTHSVPVAPRLVPLARVLHRTVAQALEGGITPNLLAAWTAAWAGAVDECEGSGERDLAEELALAGGVRSARSSALTPFAPLKAEWLAQYFDALWKLVNSAEEPHDDSEPGDAATAAAGIARTTAAHYPAYLRMKDQDRALLPASEGRIWSIYGGVSSRDEGGFAGEALRSVVTQLLTLQPEAAGHLRCLAWGPGAADILAGEAMQLLGTSTGRGVIGKIELFCVGGTPADRPEWSTLAAIDDQLRGQRDIFELRYLPDLETAQRLLRSGSDSPAVHLALVTGLTEGGQRLQIESPEVSSPPLDDEVLFAPRVWQRPKQDRRTLLMPPAVSSAGRSWLRLQNAVEDDWPETADLLRVPEIRTATLDVRAELELVHELALWVATLDRYATRDSLEQALGGQVAILHQERRLGGDSPLSLVLSQRSGGPADRAIGRSLRAAGIVSNPDLALDIGTDLRKVASQGYGILALQAATSGAGINELVGHVVAFSLLATTATPWPLPPGCRVLLISLDEYRHWFPGKRADLLAIAIDPEEGGVHVACIEVKARRSDETDAVAGAIDQLNQTLAATRWAAYPEQRNIHSRLWLNRIAEAAYAVARESRFRLDVRELAALEAFRLGRGSLEWAGVGLVFGPNLKAWQRIQHNPVGNDIVPIAMYTVALTEELLRSATATDLTKLRTVETDRSPLTSSRVRRRPETAAEAITSDAGRHRADSALQDDNALPTGVTTQPSFELPVVESEAHLAAMVDIDLTEVSHEPPIELMPSGRDVVPASGLADEGQAPELSLGFKAPLIGWDGATGEPLHWHPAGPLQNLNNGHVEIWGSSGMGKTQFVMALLAQLSRQSGSRFGIADFKNDYSSDTGFPEFAAAEFLDLWDAGVPYNPLALENSTDRAIDTAVIELRDTVDEAARTFVKMGHRQKKKLESALHKAYAVGRAERRWPTLKTLDDELDEDLTGVMGDLTRYELFKDGPPLGDVINRNVVFGLSKIPGNGQTTVLAAGFILSALLLRIQNLPPVPNSIRYVAVVDEAHRVSDFRAVQTMIREGRSKGLSVVLATQQPLDLPGVVAANAQTKICFGLPDATVAAMAARRLDPNNTRLPEQIRTLGVGEAYVSLAGNAPRLVRMVQAYRDHEVLQVPSLRADE